MNKVRLILTVITIAINVVPVVGVLLVNRNDLLGIVVPPEMNTAISSVIAPEAQLGAPLNFTFVDSKYNSASRVVTLTFEVANPMPFNVTVDSMSAGVRCDEHDFYLGHVVIANPVAILEDETAAVNVAGPWTQEATTHLLVAHGGAQKIDVELTGVSVAVNGISVQTGEIIKIPCLQVK